MIHFSYCLDAAGNLIRLLLDCNESSLIPGAAVLVTEASELEHPLPWTKTVADAVNEVRFVPRPHVLGTSALLVQESRKLLQSPFVFVPPVSDFAAEDKVMEMIELFDEVPAGHEAQQEIIEALGLVGVQQIPFITKFFPEIHDGHPAASVEKYTSAGWISYSKVYRKARVE